MSGSSPKLRVAIVANSVWNIRNFRRGIVNALFAAGHEVFLIAPADDSTDLLQELPAVFLPLRHLSRWGIQPLRELLLAQEIYRLYRKHQIDWAFHFTAKPVVYGSLAARWAGVKSIATLTGLGYTFLRGNITAGLMKRLYAFALHRTEAVFYHNPDDRTLLLEAGVGSPERSFVVGGSGLPLSAFPVQSYDLAVPGRFLFVGRLLVDKGIREFVAAAKIVRQNHPELSFHVVGAPDPGNPASIKQDELDAWMATGEVTFHGQVNDVRPYLTEASVVVLPSYREGCPRSLLEAAATGRALIGTDVPGVREVVLTGRNGVLVEVRNGEKLALGMESLRDSSELKIMGVMSRHLIVEKFSEGTVIEEYLARI